VGRGRELSLFEEIWSAVTDGSRQVVFLGGVPGAGKSRLLAEVATTLHRHDAVVLVGTCVAELGLPYQPFAEPIAAVLEAGADERNAQRLAALSSRSEGTWRGDEQPEHQRQLYDAAVTAFRKVASQHPLVLALEDVHWAGEPALQFMTYLAERTAGCRVLIVATHRTTAPEQAEPLTRVMTRLDRLGGVQRLDLGPLDLDDVAAYLVHETGASPRKAAAAAAVLHAQSGGNPFFLRELWRDLSSRGGLAAIDPGHVSAPQSVRDAFRIRLDGLAPGRRQALETAAVLGDDFEVAVLLATAGSTDDALTALDEGVALGVIEEMPGAADTFRFPHALARQAVLDLTPPSRRLRAHARVAEVIEGSFPVLDRRIQRLAHHYATAHALGLARKAVHYLTEAGRRADGILAHAEAATLFERASSLAEDPGERDELGLRAARSHFLAADFTRARKIDELVCTTTGVQGKRMRAAIGFENACFRDARPSPRAVELLTGCLRDRPGDPADPLFVRALAGLGRALSYVGDSQSAQVADTAVEFARALGDDSLLAAALQASVTSARERTRDTRLTLARATELCDLAKRTRSIYDLGPAAVYRALDAYLLGEPDVFHAAESDLRLVASETGQSYFEYLAGCARYGRQFTAGEFGAAEATCTRLRELSASTGTKDTEGSVGLQMYMIRRETGALESVRPLITGDENPAEQWPPGLLAIYTELGLRRSAARLLDWMFENDSLDHGTSQRPGVLAFIAEAVLLLEDEAAARRLRPLMAEFSGLNLVCGEFSALFGSADHYLAAIDSLLGTGQPENLFAAALELDVKSGSPVHEAQTLAALVAHRRRRGTAHRDDEPAIRAGALVEKLGLFRVGRALGVRGSPLRPDGLTAREIEVLALLGAGLSNRDIAKQLVIAENTAANHVRSVLMKTGSANRTQAAIYAATHGLRA
jgi:DNA-binding CsgD family transcriptional regulator